MRAGIAADEGIPVAVAERHHDQHRLRLAAGDEVVENHVGPTDRGPGGRVVAEAVQKVQDRVGRLRRGIVAGRGVDEEIAVVADEFVVVELVVVVVAGAVLPALNGAIVSGVDPT